MLQAADIDRPCLPAEAPSAPSMWTLPARSWDTHAHVIGSPAEWPFTPDRFYTPPPADLTAYLAMLNRAGLAYGVLVQISVHGTDNGCMLQALRAEPRRLRGIAVVDATTAEDHDLAQMRDAGVVGLRLTSMGGAVNFDQLEDAAALCTELGWHLQLCAPPEMYVSLQARLGRLKIPYSIEHMGFSARADEVVWRDNLLGLLSDTQAYIKLTSAFRLSALGPPYADIESGATTFISHAPDRMLWGTDWPHVGLFHPQQAPLVGDLLDALIQWGVDTSTLQKMMVTNPSRLYLGS